MATFDQFIASLENEFGEQGKGKAFEVFCKWFLKNDPEWSKRVDKVWLWDEYPNKWQSQDLGTDLVFKDKEGLTWAVQAKCYSEHRTTTKSDMNSFLADTGRSEVDRRLWMQTTNKIEAKAEKTIRGQDKHVTIITLNDFRDAHLDYPPQFSDLHEAKVKAKPKPDPHQIKAIQEATDGLKTSDRGQMIMACGTGKTFTTLWIKEALEAHTTLVLLPSLSLLSQTMREWAWAGNTGFEILNVCSDKTVGKKTEDMDPADAPFPVSSEVDEIAEFLKQPKPKVVFCTYQSSDLIAQAQLNTEVPAFDLAVADEAHRCAGNADAGFATILDAQKIRATKRLFTTATPRYFGKAVKDAAKANDLAVVGMDEEAVFGPVIHKLTFGQAIKQELLTDYQVVIVGVDEPMVKEWIESYQIVSADPDNPTDARTLAAKIGILKAVKDYDLKRVISFHSRVAGAKQFSDELVEVTKLIEPANRPEGTFLSDYVSGAMKAGDRKEKIDRLKVLEGYDRGILTNARCLAEGVDVPSLDGVAFIDPRGSQVEIIQAVGRAIRKVRGAKIQKKGTIVLPVFIEDGDDHEASIEASNFKPVWDVLKALRAHDEILADTLDKYRTNMAKNANAIHQRISDKIIFDLPLKVDGEFAATLRTILVERTTASWEFFFGTLERYKEIEGHCNVPTDYRLNDSNLGMWVSRQRATRHALSSERIDKLNRLGFVWDPYSEAWEHGYRILAMFKQEHGHCNVKHSQKYNGFRLGGWVAEQRTQRQNMKPDRRQKLDDLGFSWDPMSDYWEKGFLLIQEFKKANGHCRVPALLKVDGYKLGQWVAIQRRTKTKMTLERKRRLDEIGFSWDPLADRWQEGFNNLLDYVKINGNFQMTKAGQFNGFPLSNWVNNLRNTKNKLTHDQIKKLDEIGFPWDPKVDSWEATYNELLKYVKKNGHCKVPAQYTVGSIRLGSWVSRQRYAINTMSRDQKQRLDDLGFIWDPHSDAWEKGYNTLVEFQQEHGHCKVTKGQKYNGYNLGDWVSRQRSSKCKMSEERLQKLTKLGLEWNSND